MATSNDIYIPDGKKKIDTPTVLQMEAVECGAASLAMILGYYERYEPLEVLREKCGVSRDGSKASNILKAARKYGLEAKGYKEDIPSLFERDLPCILFWEFNHFVVLEGFDKENVYINDPAAGKRKISHKEFDKSYTGIVLTFTPGPDFEPGGEKPSAIKGLILRLQHDKPTLSLIIIAGLLLIIPGIVVPIFSKIFVDEVLVKNLDSWIRPLLLAMGVTVVIQGLLSWMQKRYLLRLQTKLSIRESSRFFWHVLRLPVNFFAQRFVGDIANRVSINDRVAQLLTGRLATAAISCVTVLFYLILMVLYDWVLSIAAFTVAALNLAAVQWYGDKIKDGNMYLQKEQGKLMGMTMNGIQMMETLKATGTEADFFSRWAGYQTKVTNANQKVGKNLRLLGLVPVLLSSLLTAVVLTFGAYRVIQGEMTAGMLVAYQALVTGFIHPFQDLANLGSDIKKIEGDINRLDDVFRNPVDIPEDPPESQKSPDGNAAATKLLGYLEIENLTFGYNQLEDPLIEEFNLSLEPGDRVALVGASGSGKSTVAKLIMGLFEPWEGQIKFDGQSREQWPRQVLNHSLASVNQDIMLFEGTIRENLTLWNPHIPEEQIVRAAKNACIHDVIASRDKGYDSEISEGGRNFSGGQQQRLEIARSLVLNPRILVLDEATSALDPLVEKEIDDNVRRMGCTCVIVAHRLSTIRDCDEIIVLDHGKIAERGNHEELFARQELYTQLIDQE